LFRGTFTLEPGGNYTGSGKVRAAPGDTVFAEYVKAGVTVQANAIVDVAAPVIANIFLEPDYDGALVTWDTSEPADSLVQYGESLLLGRTEYSSELSDSHELRLSGLLPDRVYYYKVVSRDMAGNTVEDDNGGHLYTFRTLRPLTPPWYDNLESGAADWSVQDADGAESTWTLGVPSDPWDGNAWGSNLDGRPLDYTETFLISPAIDLTGGNEATLSFYQQYDFTQGGDIDIEGGQLMIITNSVTAPILIQEYTDAQAWDEEVVDLTPYVGHIVYLVWYYQLFAFEDAIQTPGWLIDDVRVTVSTVSPGTIRVTNNLAQARFVLSGRGVNRSGQGLNTVFSNLPPADYSVSWTEVPYYVTPSDQTGTLVSGGSLAFGGTYTFPDANNNGISDIWENEYFHVVDPARTRTTDTDRDGSTDYAEFIAGTDPNSAVSYLKLIQPTVLPGNMIRIQWTSSPGRAYRVEGTANGLNWSPLTDWIQPIGASASATLPMSAALMLRVAVRP